MSMLNIRIDDHIKSELQEIAKLKNISLSNLVLSAVNEMVENEFDYYLASNVLEQVRQDKEDVFSDEDMRKYLGLED